MPTSKWLMFAVLLGVNCDINAAIPIVHHINASELGTGVARNIDWDVEGAASPVWCGTACSYMQVSAVKIAPDSLLTYKPTAWPGSYASSNSDVLPVARSTTTPAGTTDSSGREIVYESAYYERGAVDSTRVGQSLTANVYQSGNQGSSGTGSATAAVAYHVKVQNQGGSWRDFFVRFTAPKSTGGIGVPYYIGGPSGQQPFNVSQKKYAKSRSAVDVLVDGLPVWSTASSYVIPEETSSSTNYSGFLIDFGSASDNDIYTVFVGRFDSGDIFDLDFIVRAESLARAPNCGKETESALYPNPRVLMHCFSIAEGRVLPPSSAPAGHFEIYSKVVSTVVPRVIPWPLGTGLATAPLAVELNSIKVQ